MRWYKMDDDFFQSLEFVAFDTETTGLWAAAHRIVELGAVKFRLGDYKTERFQSLVNPERKIPTEVIRVHGITNTMVHNAETIKPVLEQFIEFCGPDSILIAHNALFDISFVGCELSRVKLPIIENPVLDTVDLARHYYPGMDSYSLLSLIREFNIDRSQNHRAADDAALVWKLFVHISENFPFVKSFKDLKRYFNFYSMSQWQGETKPLPEEYSDIDLAIDDGLRLEIVYAADGRPPQKRIVRPLRIHILKSTFYVAAYCEKAEDERTFRLDRIQSFRLLR